MAGATNFQQWNPSQANQETDAQYTADSQRVGGAPVGTPFPSKTGNKLFYQSSTGITALMQMMAAKGYTVNDTNISTLASVLSAIQTTNDQKALLTVVAYSPTVTLDASKSIGFEIILTGNCTINIAGAAPGDVITIILLQDASGNRLVNVNNMFPGSTVQQINYTASSATILTLIQGATYLVNDGLCYLGWQPVQNGTGVGQLPGNNVKMGWSGSRLKATVDATDLGNVVFDTQLTAQATAFTALLDSFLTGTLATNGILRLPIAGGATLILQWGLSGNIGTGDNWGSIPVTFPTAFPNAVFAVTVSPNNSAAGTFGHSGRALAPGVQSLARTGFTLQCQCTDPDQNIGNPVACYWFAVGY